MAVQSSPVQYSKVEYWGEWDCETVQGTKSMLYFTEEKNCNFTEDCLGLDEGSAATRVSSQTVLSKIRNLLRGKI